MTTIQALTMIHHLASQSPQVAGFFQYLHTLSLSHVPYGYYVDQGTPDAPTFVLQYGGNAVQSFLLALHNPVSGCFSTIAQGC